MSDSAAPVDYSLIEPSKENIQPLRQGRNPHLLLKTIESSISGGGALKKPGEFAAGHTEASVKAARKKFEEAIKSYPADGDNPLAPWLAYISWTQQTYLSASVKSHLLPLLEKCTRTFLKNDKVKSTLKYLHLWFLYMDLVDDPLDMFAFLHSNQIGLQFAQLYEGWAMVLENKKLYEKAGDVLQMGITAGAEPKTNLMNSMTRLQARIAKRIVQQVEAGTHDDDGVNKNETSEARTQRLAQKIADENGTVARAPLQRIGAAPSSQREALFERPANGQTVYANASSAVNTAPVTSTLPLQPVSTFRPSATATNNVNSFSGLGKSNANTGNFQVFCDDMASALPPAPTATASSSSSTSSKPSSSKLQPSQPQWKEFGTVANVGKENRNAATTWNAPLYPSATPAEPTTAVVGEIIQLPQAVASDFPVFVDPECEAEEAEKARKAANQAVRDAEQSNPRKRLEGPLKASAVASSTQAKLQANPLRNMKPSSTSSSSSVAATPAPASK